MKTFYKLNDHNCKKNNQKGIESMKIKRSKKMGNGSVFDFDWKLTIIDRTKRPFRKQTLTRTQMLGVDPMSCVSDIDDYIDFHHMTPPRPPYEGG